MPPVNASPLRTRSFKPVHDGPAKATRLPEPAVRKEDAAGDAFEGKKVTYGRGPRIDQERADFNQGRTNACGTTALAIALHSLGKDVPVAEIDKSIRNFNLFTSSEGIQRYAQGAGFQAERYEEGNFEQLQRDLAAGREVIVLTDVGGRDAKGYLQRGPEDDTGLHYMHVTEVGTDQNGQQYVTFNNWGHQETLPYADFEKLWTDLHFMGAGTGYDRHYLLVDKADAEALPASNLDGDSRIADDLSDGVSQLATGAADLKRGDVWGGLSELRGGVKDLLTGAGRLLKGLFS
jgi:X-X-X-Leu-X-X-Gly heptad repeat protein